MKPYTLRLKDRPWVLGERALVMGIVNVTPDSFSDGGLYRSPDRAVERALALVREGADILDIGGESTRPFSEPVPAREEMERVIPVILRLSSETRVPISIDTSKAEVASAAITAGASIINDVSALSADPGMAEVAAAAECPVILMHMLGTPRTMQAKPVYEDVVSEVSAYLRGAMDRAEAAGIERSQLLVDPGIGFGKTAVHNLLLVKCLARIQAELDAPLLLGASRKSFLRKVLSSPSKKPDPTRDELFWASDAVSAIAGFTGVHVLRVHDVARTRAALAVAEALRRCEQLDPELFETAPGS